MVDALVTQHSKWTAKRVRRALFGQSLVDFDKDPWIGIDNQDSAANKKSAVQKKAQKKQSRLERAFSQAESSQTIESTQIVENPSQAVTISESSPREATDSLPDGTVYFSIDPHSQQVATFQDFSAFQKQTFQHAFQQSSYPNAHFIQEHDFSTGFPVFSSQPNFLEVLEEDK